MGIITRSKPILITGSHRSGSTWVGKVLSTSPELGYIREPFNIEVFPRTTTAPIKYWFTKIDTSNEKLFLKGITETVQFKYRPFNKIKEVKSLRDIARFFVHWVKFFSNRVQQKRPLLKDPIALFSAPWVYETFGAQIIVLIRHPAAFVSSILKANWSFDFNHFAHQPILMNELPQFEEKIKLYAKEEQPLIDQAILLWNIFHSFIFKQKQTYKEWIFIRHEDLSLYPMESFTKLMEEIGVTFNQEKASKYFSSSKPVIGIKDKNNQLFRDPAENIKKWKKDLSSKEVEYIYQQVVTVSQHFYKDSEW